MSRFNYEPSYCLLFALAHFHNFKSRLQFNACQEGLLTFSQVGHGEWNADDSHQVFNRNQRPQNGSDTYRFTFTSVDQLIENGLGYCEYLYEYVCLFVCVQCVVTHMHLRSTAAQQVNESSIEGHDGIAHVDGIIFLLLQHVTATHTNAHTHTHNNR